MPSNSGSSCLEKPSICPQVFLEKEMFQKLKDQQRDVSKQIVELASTKRQYVDTVLPSFLHPRFFDEQLSSAVGAIGYVRGSGN